MENPLTHRNDARSKAAWTELKGELATDPHKKWPSVAGKCSCKAINIQSLLSPPNLLWDLQAFDTVRQLVVDIFHNLHEGHCNEFYKLFRVFTPLAKQHIDARWADSTMWSPNTGTSTDMTGIEFLYWRGPDIL